MPKRCTHPLLAGDVRCAAVDMAPALCPNKVTREGSPPNAAMLACTHCSASRWSCNTREVSAAVRACGRATRGQP